MILGTLFLTVTTFYSYRLTCRNIDFFSLNIVHVMLPVLYVASGQILLYFAYVSLIYPLQGHLMGIQTQTVYEDNVIFLCTLL